MTHVNLYDTVGVDPSASHLKLVSAEDGLDWRRPGGCTQQLLEQAKLISLSRHRSSHDLPKILLLAEKNPSCFQ